MNNLINAVVNWVGNLPSFIKWLFLAGGAILLAIFIWYRGTLIWNGIGNWLFARQINAERLKVEKDLKDAAAQKLALEQTLKDFAAAKVELQEVKAEKDRLEKIFNDQSKTAAAKVAEFKKAVSDDPIHTPTDNVTLDDLCTRAKAAGSSAATITALCGQ
jgi:phospholipase/lecithinase/hemolysin